MTQKQRFFYNGILLTAVAITMRTVALFFNAYVTQSVGAEGVGLYTLVMTVYNFAVTFAASGISLTVTRLVATAIGEGRTTALGKILKGAAIYALIFSTLATLVLFFGADFFAAGILSDKRAAACLKILSVSLPPIALVSVFSGYFVGIRKVACNAVTQIFSQIFKIALTVFLISSIGRRSIECSAFILSLGTAVTEIMAFAVILVELLIERRGKPRESGAQLLPVAKMAIPLSLSAYVRQALLTLEHVLIPKRLESRGDSHATALASYGTLHGMALPMILYPMATLSSFSGLLVPEFAGKSAEGDSEGMSRICSKAFTATLVYAIATCIFLFIFSEELGYVVYNSHSAGYYIAVLAPVIPLMYLDHVTDSVLKGIGEHVYSMWINIFDSFLSVALVYLLIPRMGIMGYAVCIILMEAFNFSLSLIRLMSRIKVRINLRKAILNPAAAALVSALISDSLFLKAGAQTAPIWLFLEIAFAVCIFFAVYKALDLITNRKAADFE